MMMLFIVAYAIAGTQIFGQQLREYKNEPEAFKTLFLILLGEFDFARMERVDPTAAIIFFYSYVGWVFFVMLNIFLAILNVLPISLDCRQSMQSWLGVPHECTEVENFLNLMWCIALLGFGLMTAGVAALPKLTQYTSPSPGYPQKINQLAMQVLAICHLIVLSWMLVASLTMTVHVDGTVADLSSLMAIAIAFLPLLLYCLWIHREPTTGDWIIMV